ncbi:hypothetical protein [Mycoplasma seminis]|uniref:Rho termination factor N-terminal domain-containing protein n=1 Tax=Mycoplasma seminis TaxID=512749 RepID=A0ABY9HAQ8_9MOLU|nr:hypothetical protein [Mycoplasma seminis]WLP85521.1 hypothetical protein Q8852_04360 [Mycoplasma seminis]
MFFNMRKFNPYDFQDEAQLYEKYKKYFTMWVWILFASLACALALILANIIITSVNFDLISKYGYFKEGTEQADKFYAAIIKNNAQGAIQNNLLIYNIIQNVVFAFIFVWLEYLVVSGWVKATNEKSYARYPRTIYMVTFFLALYNLLNLTQFIQQPSMQSYAGYSIALFIISLFYAIVNILAWIFPARQMSIIVRMFIGLQQAIQWKKIQSQYAKMMKEGKNPFDIFGMFGQEMAAEMNAAMSSENIQEQQDEELAQSHQEGKDQNTANKQNTTENRESLEQQEAVKKLLEIPNNQLFQMAQILNISGYEDMSKQELATLIYKYTKQAQARYNEVEQDQKEDK